MATNQDLDFTYSLIDKIFRLSIGETADFSGAKYDGDFSMSLEEAQRRKHEYVAESINAKPDDRVLDIGCGWGPLMTYLNAQGVETTGVTLSQKQAAACRRNGLDVHIKDCRTITRDTFGPFDSAASLGAFEHFCSVEEYRAGQQDAIYGKFFENIAGVLPPGGRFFVQTMVFGPNMIPYDEMNVDAPHMSDGHIVGLIAKTFPGSWLPYGAEQVERNAGPHFRLVEKSSGRLDYLETIRQWRKRFAEPSFRKFFLKLSLAPRYFLSRDFRLAFNSGISANSVCFERLMLDHYRLVFERRA